MTVSAWDLTLYAGALLILFLTPGPVWLALMARSLSGGFQAAWPLAVGVACGDILWPLIAVAGMSWVVSEFTGIMTVLRWVACLVFLGMGYLLIRHAGDAVEENRALTRPGVWAGFMAGIAAILGNPKAILFYMGVLPGFFDLSGTSWPDVAAIVTLSFVIPLVGNLALVGMMHRVRRAVTSTRIRRRINLVSGALLICVGLVIPFT
ncbi:LysE family translocator [Leisingera daeponensis]|uniref:LysE family translocator n=1 Tax=Leisingera daeponensis TaxID=405746 RepID=A0ABS7NKB3_9RHOB|nr:LysE family translocator [Leisingera daeponensis]MBY6141653.1 LysE family translocator [Leisingera daeponensis]